MISVERCNEQAKWDDYVLDNGGHPLQLWGWGETKVAHGWIADRLFVKNEGMIIGGVQLLVKPLPGGIKTLAYIPRGPVTAKAHRAEVLQNIAEYAKTSHRSLAVTIEPHWHEFDPPEGWRRSTNTILHPRTLILNLAKSEDELQADMSKKTRQYIRKSSKEEGMTVRQVKSSEEIEQCLAIYHETARRAQFALHGDGYYRDIFKNLGDASPVFGVFYEGTMIAFLWLAVTPAVAFELYGGVTDKGQELRANYALKWHAIQTMKKWGIEQYDMNGLLNDGISTFKQGFASHEDMLVGTYDKPLSPLYTLWNNGLPVAKKIVRAVKNR